MFGIIKIRNPKWDVPCDLVSSYTSSKSPDEVEVTTVPSKETAELAIRPGTLYLGLDTFNLLLGSAQDKPWRDTGWQPAWEIGSGPARGGGGVKRPHLDCWWLRAWLGVASPLSPAGEMVAFVCWLFILFWRTCPFRFVSNSSSPVSYIQLFYLGPGWLVQIHSANSIPSFIFFNKSRKVNICRCSSWKHLIQIDLEILFNCHLIGCYSEMHQTEMTC